MSQPTTRTLGTIIYCVRHAETGPEVLMMYRHKEPNLDLWVAPGGKVEIHESPRECALRELQEETGLTATHLQFRGLVTEVSPLQHWQWLLFIYVATAWEGDLQADEREGRLEWLPIADLAALPIPASDALFGPAVLDPARPFFEATMVFDETLTLIESRVVGQEAPSAEQSEGP